MRCRPPTARSVDPPPPNEGDTDTQQRLRNRLTDRAMMVIDLAAEATSDRQHVTSVELAEALVQQGNNLALTVLRSLDIEPDDLINELQATVSAALRSGTELVRSLAERNPRSGRPGRPRLRQQLHRLRAPAAGDPGRRRDDPAVVTLRTLGLDLATGRSAVRAAQGGYSYAQGNLSLTALSAPVRSVLEEIRQRLGRLEQTSG